MFRKLWQNSFRSVCSINIFSASNIDVLGVTGFKVGNQIITDDAVYSAKDADHVAIRFYKDDGITVSNSKIMPYTEFLSLLPNKNDFDQLGFAIIPADFQEFKSINGLLLCKACSSQIGQSISVIGYQAEHKNLSLKTGFISSNFVNDKGLSFIQYDGTIKPGNSGAPLIDAEYGNVLGIVMNKELALSKSYHELTKIIDSNLKTLKEFEGKMNLFDIDPIQVLIANQSQIKHNAKEFFMNATVKIGLAIEIDHVVEYLDGRTAIDSEPDKSTFNENA
jgi:hypothetical protein